MIPVMQTEFGEKGNCFSACLASLFDLHIEEVPNFFLTHGSNATDWWNGVRQWLKIKRYGLITLELNQFLLEELKGYYIVSGQSPRELQHSTIWRNGTMVHDPHPDKTGLLKCEYVDLIYPLFD